MTVPRNITTLEQKKFMEIDGEVAVRTNGKFQYRGLSTGGRITEVSINASTWTPIPAVSLANRNALSIQNVSGETIKLNYDPSVLGFTGILILAGAERMYDVTENITIYAKSESTSVTITVEELA